MWLELGMFIALLTVYIGIVAYLKKKDLFERYNLTLWGPVLMVRTEKGLKLMDRIAKRRRFWRAFGILSFIFLLIMMVVLTFLMISSVGTASQVPEERALKANEVLALPGINPLMPFWYSLVGLIVAVVLHEFAHGILARVGRLKVKSMGVLFLIIPIGAFVEPDEEEMEEAPKHVRRKVYSVGPGMNFFVAIVCALIFSWGFMGSLDSAHEGVFVVTVTKDFPAMEGGVEPGMIIYKMNVTGTRNVSGTPVLYQSQSNFNDLRDFNRYMQKTRANDTAKIWIFFKGEEKVIGNVTLADKYNATGLDRQYAFTLDKDKIDLLKGGNIAESEREWEDRGYLLQPDSNISEIGKDTWNITSGSYNYTVEERNDGLDVYVWTRGMGFLGVAVNDHEATQKMLAAPVQSAMESGRTPGEKAGYTVYNLIYYSVMLPLPITGVMPFQPPVTDAYVINGPLAGLGGGFWIIASGLYYIFWLNLLLGAFNALPMVPMDGGAVFRDLVHTAVSKFQKNKEKADNIANSVAVAMSLLLVGVIVWVFIAPWI